MSRIKERYYYNTRAQALDNLSMAKALGIHATIKKLNNGSYVMNVYGGTPPPVTYHRTRI